MCDVMPTIPEDAHSQFQVERDSQLSGESGNVEDMLLSMLDERDRLMVGLKEAREELQATQLRLRDLERERDSLQTQLSSTIPADILTCTRELNATKEELAQRNEEVVELKAERNNTRLLLEHLECLVSRHERSLRMTVVKRHNLAATTIPGTDDYNGNSATSSSGISSEVEVLKALKSLFEHHKALDEKVRERLKTAITRASQLEQELTDLKANYPTSEGRQIISVSSTDRCAGKTDVGTLTDLPLELKSTPTNKISPGQDSSYDSSESMRQRIAELMTHSCELEQKLTTSSRELARANNQISQLHAELTDSENKRTEQEAKVVSLDQKYLSAQREIAAAQNQADKLRTELASRATQLKQMEEKVARLQASLESNETTKGEVTSGLTESGKPDQQDSDYDFTTVAQFQQQIVNQKSKINSLSLQLTNAQDHIKELTEQLDDSKSELIRAHEREKLNEEHNERLSSTVDTLLLEANERLQSHLSERMSALQQKRDLVCEVERLRSALEEVTSDREAIAKEAAHLRRRFADSGDVGGGILTSPLGRQKSPADGISNLDTVDALLAVDPSGRLICDHGVSTTSTSVVYSVRPSIMSSPIKPGAFISNNAFSADQPGPIAAKFKDARAGDLMNGGASKEYANIPWSVGYSSMGPNYSQSQPPAMHEISTSYSYAISNELEGQQQSDPQALATLIQQQLEVINDEIKMIQEEKKNTDQRANELRSRVGGGRQSQQADVISTASFTPFETADSGVQMGCWSPTSSLQQLPYKPLGGGSYVTGSLPRQAQLGEPSEVYRKAGDASVPPPMSQLRSHQRAYSVNPFGERVGSESAPTLPRRGYQTGYPLPKKHAYDAEMPQNVPQPRTTRRGVGGLGEGAGGSQTLPTRMRGPVDQREYVSVASQVPRYGPGGKPHLGDIPEAVNMHSQLDSRRRPIDSFRITPRPDDVFWSPPESHMYQNTRMLDSPLDTMDTRGQRTGPGSRHRPKDPQKLDEEGYPLHSLNSRQQEPPIPRRQWNPEDPNRSLPRDVSLEVEKTKSRFPPHSAQEEKRWQRSEDLIDTALRTKIPFAVWNAATVVAWLEHWVGMPAWYVAACRANITSGGMIASLSDQEVQRELGISNPLHRLKLRVAVQEMIAYTSNPGTATSNGGISGTAPIDLPLFQWVGNMWLATLGLTQYRRQFMECLVDGRMLEHLTKRDLRVHLKVVDGFHRLSIQCGIALLKRFNYDIDAIEERRLACLNKDTDLIVWTNDRVTNWLTTLGILDTNISLDQSGLHGAVLALDADMDTPTLATILQIPNSNIEARELLEYHLFNLVKPYRSLRLSYINLDNPAFTSDEREDYPWENEEVGMEVEDPTRGYKESTPQRGGGPPLIDASYSSSSVGKSIPPSSSSAKGHIH